WVGCRRTAHSCGSRAGTTRRCTSSTRAPGRCSTASPSAGAPTGSACSRSRAATAWATPVCSGDRPRPRVLVVGNRPQDGYVRQEDAPGHGGMSTVGLRKDVMALSEKQEALCRESGWDFSDLRALFINCTLKRSPELSHTEGLARISMEIM